MLCGWVRFPSMPSSTCSCARLSNVRRGWIWRTVHICLRRKSPPLRPPTTWCSWRPADMDTPQVLLDHHLKTLRLPTFLREYDKVAQQCAAEGVASQASFLVVPRLHSRRRFT